MFFCFFHFNQNFCCKSCTTPPRNKTTMLFVSPSKFLAHECPIPFACSLFFIKIPQRNTFFVSEEKTWLKQVHPLQPFLFKQNSYPVLVYLFLHFQISRLRPTNFSRKHTFHILNTLASTVVQKCQNPFPFLIKFCYEILMINEQHFLTDYSSNIHILYKKQNT